MRSILHIMSATANARAEAVITAQHVQSELRIEVVDLRGSEPDYGALLEKIFAADSVAVW